MSVNNPVGGTVRIGADGTAEVAFRLHVERAAPTEPEARPPAAFSSRRRIKHSPDFSFVKWGEYQFSFSPKQRCVVAALFSAREEGYRDLRQEYLLELAESECRRLRDLFRDHPAWGTLIVSAHLSGGPLGAFRLAD